MNGRHRYSLLAAVLLAGASLAMGASASPAQQAPMNPAMHGQEMPAHPQNMPMHHGMHHKGMGHRHGMMGMHNMPGTVTSVDHATGIVRLDSLGMHLVVHFPPPTIKELKAGDSISLHLGYRITGK